MSFQDVRHWYEDRDDDQQTEPATPCVRQCVVCKKPFDCIGTIGEVNLALCRIILENEGKELPDLLRIYKDSSEYAVYKDRDFNESLVPYFPGNLPGPFADILKTALYA